ncbi:MAG: metallophosphoesterase [Oscillospiraceae bacterium]|nr:metallophosphoesterase [Oscillospiraceae bacterium]
MKKSLKIALSIVLAAVMLSPPAISAGAVSEDRAFSIVVASDLHYIPYGALPPISDTGALPGDPVYSNVNDKFMLLYEADAVIDEFLFRAEASGAEYLLIPGDLSEGRTEEFLEIAGKLIDFQNRSGVKVFVLPGNHDTYRIADISEFIDIFYELGFSGALARHEDSASYTAELDAGYRLLAIDPLICGEIKTYISPELFDWIKEQMLSAKNDGKKLIAMTHYSVLEHFWLDRFIEGLLTVDQYKTLASVLADGGVKYVFTGHEHINDISYAISARGNKIFDIQTGCLLVYPNAYREVEFSDAGVSVATKYIDKINTSLIPADFSPGRIALMENDFPSYSYNYMKAGFQGIAYIVSNSTKSFADSLNIAEGSAAYDGLGAMLEALQKAMQLPMYDSGGTGDSIEKIAKMSGFSLEPSEYKNLLDLAGTVYAGHSAGNEIYAPDSLETRLVHQGLGAVLTTALTDMPVKFSGALLAAIGMPEFKLFGYIPPYVANGIYARSAAKVVVNELVNTLAAGILMDWSAPDDLNAVFEPYGANWGRLDGRAVKITWYGSAFDTIMRVLKMGFNIFKEISANI